MKNNKNKQNLVALWTYKYVWIDADVDQRRDGSIILDEV